MKNIQIDRAPYLGRNVVVVAVFLVGLAGCSCARKTNERFELMSNEEFQFLVDKKLTITSSMRRYMLSGDVSYMEEDILKCSRILDEFLLSISIAENRLQGKESVRIAVLKLNALSDKHEDLIETGERERICDLMTMVGVYRGFNTEDEDVTELWREW